MLNVSKKKFLVQVIVTLALLSLALGGCGDTEGTHLLSAFLADFSALIDEYQAAVKNDKSKMAEWDAKIKDMNHKWIEMRDEHGDNLTIQHMEKIVQQYNALMAKHTEFKKKTISQ